MNKSLLLLVGILAASSAFSKGDYTPIFDGKTMNGWHILDVPPEDKYYATPENFFVKDGAIHCFQLKNKKGGLVLSDGNYADFELEFDFKNAWGCDSGIMIRCNENGQTIKGGKGGMTDMGTHVPLVAYWKGKTPKGKVLPDLVDFTDLYPTLAAAAGVVLKEGDPIDGRSFYPQLLGDTGHPRDWALCHYQPYWNKTPGQFARTAEYKLYRDGRFFKPADDLKEEQDLSKQIQGDRMVDAHKKLKAVLESAPPAPTKSKGRDATVRPVYPEWSKL